MKYYDMYVGAGNLEDTVKIAKTLGWDGLGVIMPLEGARNLNSLRKTESPFDVSVGVEIQTQRPKELKRILENTRKTVEIVAVKGGDLEVNRIALSSPAVDILVRPWSGRRDCGLNHILVKLAKKNNVSILFDFNEAMYSSRRTRIGLMSYMEEAARLVKKYNAPFVISSGAAMPFDLRSPSDLLSFGRILGLKDPEINKAMSDKIVKENRKRLGKKWVMPGVEVE
jgi:ribonuclease P/MRP protein subunit RPP1